ncbi:MAG: UDP-glucose 4-epimerase, partial [uncultured Acidimicrobiales bacterium]
GHGCDHRRCWCDRARRHRSAGGRLDRRTGRSCRPRARPAPGGCRRTGAPRRARRAGCRPSCRGRCGGGLDRLPLHRHRLRRLARQRAAAVGGHPPSPQPPLRVRAGPCRGRAPAGRVGGRPPRRRRHRAAAGHGPRRRDRVVAGPHAGSSALVPEPGGRARAAVPPRSRPGRGHGSRGADPARRHLQRGARRVALDGDGETAGDVRPHRADARAARPAGTRAGPPAGSDRALARCGPLRRAPVDRGQRPAQGVGLEASVLQRGGDRGGAQGVLVPRAEPEASPRGVPRCGRRAGGLRRGPGGVHRRSRWPGGGSGRHLRL